MNYLIFILLVTVGLLITIIVGLRKHNAFQVMQLEKELEKLRRQHARTSHEQKTEPTEKAETSSNPTSSYQDDSFPAPMDTQDLYPQPHMPVPYSQSNWITSIPEEQKMQQIMGVSEEAKKLNFLRFLCLENDCRSFGFNSFSINICNLQILLKTKNLHFEFIKNGLETYVPHTDTYFGSPLWQRRWKKIVISSAMSPDELFQCIKYIMCVHYLRDDISMSDGASQRNAIQKMNYLIRIRKNDAIYEQTKINTAADLTDEIHKDNVWKSMNQLKGFMTLKLAQVAEIKDGIRNEQLEIERLRPYDGMQTGILFRKNLSSGRPEFCISYPDKVPTNTIIMTSDAPFTAVWWKGSPVILSEELIGLIISDPEHICVEYLTLFICLQVKEIDSELTSGKPLSSVIIRDIEIAFPSLEHQKALFDYCMSIPREQVFEYIRNRYPTIAHTMDKNREIIRSCYQKDLFL